MFVLKSGAVVMAAAPLFVTIATALAVAVVDAPGAVAFPSSSRECLHRI
jgi:hypothetical protein